MNEFFFEASNNRTYRIIFGSGAYDSPYHKEYERFELRIVKGEAIFLYNQKYPSIGIGPAIIAGKIDWYVSSFNKRGMYSKIDIELFVPLDLKEFCEKLVTKIYLM